MLFVANYDNGTLASTRSFADGAEFFSYAELLWSPSRGDRYTKNAHIILWLVDERENAGIPESEGIAVVVNGDLQAFQEYPALRQEYLVY